MQSDQKYTKLDKIGEGAFGIVHKAKDKDTGELVALKRIRFDQEEEGVPCTAVREISLLKELKHPHIVKLIDVIYTPKKLTLVFEFLEQDLKKFIEVHQGNLETGMIRQLLMQLLSGLAYCHYRSVLHRDLKPQNLLVEKHTLKIADFGLGRAVGIPVKRYTNEAVTLWYRAPDVLLGSTSYNAGIDLWSVGCIFYEMATGEPLFAGTKEFDQLLLIFQCLGTPSNEDWPKMHSYPLSSTYLSSSEFLVNHEGSPALNIAEVKLGKVGAEYVNRSY